MEWIGGGGAQVETARLVRGCEALERGAGKAERRRRGHKREDMAVGVKQAACESGARNQPGRRPVALISRYEVLLVALRRLLQPGAVHATANRR